MNTPPPAMEPPSISHNTPSRYRPVMVRLTNPHAVPCSHCGHVEPIDVYRFVDDEGNQYNVNDTDPIDPAHHGEVVGTWRRANAVVTVQTWRRLSTAERQAVEAEAESLPLPGPSGQIVVRWDE